MTCWTTPRWLVHQPLPRPLHLNSDLDSIWPVSSSVSYGRNEKARYPRRLVLHYLCFRNEKHQDKSARMKIPMETFHEMYFNKKVDFKGDRLEAMKYRHDWAHCNPRGICVSSFHWFAPPPTIIMHTRSQGEKQAGEYDEQGLLWLVPEPSNDIHLWHHFRYQSRREPRVVAGRQAGRRMRKDWIAEWRH